MSVPAAIPRLVVASKNPDKIVEIEAVLVREGLVEEIVKGLSWPDVEETEPTLEGNALLKARAVAVATGLPALADDTGLEVAALGGEPGVHTARFAGPGASYQDNVEKMLAVLEGIEDRRATFRSVVAVVWPDGAEATAEGRLAGTIARQARGKFGFGYDPVFEVDGRTLAEMEPEAKDTMSHRALALRALAELLGERQGKPA
ncbi:MAG TPA: RdgB/HAM1 family non-canonical purine NTP pyrophosphatase [Acidimicrobiia bacterium]|nr:RdgB/HAM1 family non-canonical purine NTP pyrophosphatase [Acidimicrobiia bacterium]